MSDTDFWFDISFGNDETAEKIRESIYSCWTVHCYTVNALNDYLVNDTGIIKYKDFRPMLYQYIYLGEMLKKSQKYSLMKAAEQAFPYFMSEPKFDDKMYYIGVKPIHVDSYKKIQVKSRKSWIQYLSNDRPITTVYGTIYPEYFWKQIVRSQATFSGLTDETIKYFLYLMHSVTIFDSVDGWKMKINLHSPDSRQGIHAKNYAEN